jgi:hypothetical protein
MAGAAWKSRKNQPGKAVPPKTHGAMKASKATKYSGAMAGGKGLKKSGAL